MNSYSLSNSRQLSCAKLILPSLIGILICAKLGKAANDPDLHVYNPYNHDTLGREEVEEQKNPDIERSNRRNRATEKERLVRQTMRFSDVSPEEAARIRLERDTAEACKRSLADVKQGWNCGVCTFLNSPALKACEICGVKPSHPPPTVKTEQPPKRSRERRKSRSPQRQRDVRQRSAMEPRPKARQRDALQSNHDNKQKWNCGFCTFENSPHQKTCEICDNPPPVDQDDVYADGDGYIDGDLDSSDDRPAPPTVAAARRSQERCDASPNSKNAPVREPHQDPEPAAIMNHKCYSCGSGKLLENGICERCSVWNPSNI